MLVWKLLDVVYGPYEGCWGDLPAAGTRRYVARD